MLSVIVPNYNHAQYLMQRIETILYQTYQDFELILLDDCSTDNSREILESYRSDSHVSHVVYNEQNSGTAFSQWNKGIQLAKGEWIWIAESDDWADPDFLETLMRTAADYPEAGVIYAESRYMQEHELVWAPECDGKVYTYSGEEYNCRHLLFGCKIANVSMMVFKRDVYTRFVQPDTFLHMHLCGDWMCYTQLCRGTTVVHVNQLLSYYGHHSHNVSSSAEHEGRTFLEGLDVIDSLVAYYHIPASRYARYWGRELYKYQRQYAYPDAVMRTIMSRLWKSHPWIAVYYNIYKTRSLWRK